MGNVQSPYEIFAIFCSATSTFFSFTIIFTAITFPSMLKKLFMRMILMIAICDLIGSGVYSFGYPLNTNQLCGIQGSLNYFFYRASFFWTLCLTYQLYTLVVRSKLSIYEYQMHLLCWGTNLLLELLPLTDSAYGQDDEANGLQWCAMETRKDDRYATATWILVSYAIPIITCVILMTIFYIRLKYYYYRFLHNETNERIKSVADAIMLYPLAMIVLWTPFLLSSTYANYNHITTVDMSNFVSISASFGSLYGTAVTIIYFTHSKEARHRWKLFLFGLKKSNVEESLLIIQQDFEEMNSYESAHRESEIHQLITVQDTIKQSFSGFVHLRTNSENLHDEENNERSTALLRHTEYF